MSSSNSISQKEYLKKYLSGDVKKKKKVSGGNIKRSVIVDDDIDLKSMRPLEDDEVELYQMDEDGPQIAGIVDERPPEVKAHEYYSSKRWKLFGGEDGVNVVDSLNKEQHASGKESKTVDKNDSLSGEENYQKNCKLNTSRINLRDDLEKNKFFTISKNFHHLQNDEKYKKSTSNRSKNEDKRYVLNESEASQRFKKRKSLSHENDSDLSLDRKFNKTLTSDPDASPPRNKYLKEQKQSVSDLERRDSWKISSKHAKSYDNKGRKQIRNQSHSKSPPRRDRTIKLKHDIDSDNSPHNREKHSYRQAESDSDASPPRKKDRCKKHFSELPRREEQYRRHEKSNSDASQNRRKDKYLDHKSHGRARKDSSSDSDSSLPGKDHRKSPKHIVSYKGSPRNSTPSKKISSYKTNKFHRDKFPRFSRRDSGKISRRNVSDSDNSLQRRSDSDLSPPRKSDGPLKKALYKPNDESSSDEAPKSKSKKMKTTLDGKQAGLQDAKQLKKELSDLKTKEDTMFSKMDASVSGIGAAPVKRDRKTGQIRDLENEKVVQREKEAKEAVLNEKYYKWGKGVKQTEDAVVRAAEVMKEMNKPLARYVDDEDLDQFLKAQEREGDPMLEYIKRKQSEATPLQGEKPMYKGSWAPNRFNIRPGYRWDGVVRSNGYEQEWFKTKNAKKARDEEAYKWSTSDM